MTTQGHVLIKLLSFAIERAEREGLGDSPEAKEWRELLKGAESGEVIHVLPLGPASVTDKFLARVEVSLPLRFPGGAAIGPIPLAPVFFGALTSNSPRPGQSDQKKL